MERSQLTHPLQGGLKQNNQINVTKYMPLQVSALVNFLIPLILLQDPRGLLLPPAR